MKFSVLFEVEEKVLEDVVEAEFYTTNDTDHVFFNCPEQQRTGKIVVAIYRKSSVIKIKRGGNDN